MHSARTQSEREREEERRRELLPVKGQWVLVLVVILRLRNSTCSVFLSSVFFLSILFAVAVFQENERTELCDAFFRVHGIKKKENRGKAMQCNAIQIMM